ncbi:hypothetical protein ANN_17446 [Periplaneta americana]|uniref:Uncharacterized protein n=1 Tax=Periplaneta americana TaxID=6978 RepID=A0ABQ8SSZ2_PERAM|nr:hypothetical protein ANN_17446 [Periplaneta americana]
MAVLCEGGNEPPGSLKAISHLNAINLARDRTRNLGHRRPALYQLANHVDFTVDVSYFVKRNWVGYSEVLASTSKRSLLLMLEIRLSETRSLEEVEEEGE